MSGVMDILNKIKGGNVSLATDYELSTRKVFRQSGELKKVSTYMNNDLHSVDDIPSVTEYMANTGAKLHEKWHKKNHLHRENGPSAIYYNSVYPEVRTTQQSHKNGKLHSFNDVAALQSFHCVDGKEVIKTEMWYQDGELSRLGDKPAEIHYTEQGEVSLQVWHVNGKISRSRGPAVFAQPKPGNGYDEVIYGHFKHGVDLSDYSELLDSLADDPDAYEFQWEMIEV